MEKTVRKFFFYSQQKLEDWLNRMAEDGWRLVDANRCKYTFTPCEKGEYLYRIDFVGGKSKAQLEEYLALLPELGITPLFKPLNAGQHSLWRVRWRPYGGKAGSLATSNGTLGRELLLLEKRNDGKPFQVYSDTKGQIAVLRQQLMAYLAAVVMLGLIFLFGSPRFTFFSQDLSQVLAPALPVIYVLAGAVELLLLIRGGALALELWRLSQKAKLEE